MIRSQIKELKARAADLQKLHGLSDKAVRDNADFGMPNIDFVNTIIRKRDKALEDLLFYITCIDEN